MYNYVSLLGVESLTVTFASPIIGRPSSGIRPRDEQASSTHSQQRARPSGRDPDVKGGARSESRRLGADRRPDRERQRLSIGYQAKNHPRAGKEARREGHGVPGSG